jgi:cholest-4-en-3-one 26-monooxygenase
MDTMRLEDIDLIDGSNFVAGVPFEWFRQLRHEAPVYWHPDPTAPRGGFWTVTGYDDCITVNRDWERFSSARRSALFGDMDGDALAQQQLMMLNMDPTMHTRYRRLVNKGFTPKLVRDLERQIVGYADGIIDAVCERGTADFVEEISAELPLLVIAELLGVPQEDRRKVFEWSNRMIGSDDPEYQVPGADPSEAAMEVFSYAEELAAKRRLAPRQDLVSVLIDAEVEGEKLDQLELDLFFMLLIVAGNETTRNLMSGAMTAFFDHPDQWELLRQDRSLLSGAVEEMLRYVTPVMHFRRTATTDLELGGQKLQEGDKVVFWHISANRDETVFTNPDTFDVTRSPNNHMAFGGGGPHFCLGANLARMEIMVMFDRLLDRIPDIRLDGKVQRLQSNFINGTKHIPVAFAPSAPVGGTPLPARAS